MHGVLLVQFDLAVTLLEKALYLYDHAGGADVDVKQAFRDACIQRFKYCIELSWTTSMKALGSATVAAKPAIQEMARNSRVP